ncbi:hypothetical protein A2443_00555 [Candidatus Nomurabacteria bacterium RIFOXYC2_FULL_43_16]|uniref:Uncharacterized protein n=1 Tax=Candidatus Nomurabacteria bacterium RIFOXYA2_FULL_42_12 TaxID=1801801 RepID=A0A1F6YP83_9BACT|nr:MAG: hypothetical protein A2225_03315 [Candidatus Nomurabacteria bacterium RIFOXYA2_FULL_42_12]OGJ08200.1 MAG: hypothetical protein A2183_02565 [Candidatus Nomurabacteria bacterium RIFOXYA1_FULL_42_12]OGJ10223.1 MAG: hypothetical protein A2443_00555 [Candidatus Nomurabacteria bacterium RIFOXYC2_FULL_43_16]
MTESDVQHELPLRSGLKPKTGKFQAEQFIRIKQIYYSSSVHRIARQAIRMPRENTICFALFNSLQHFVKDRSAWNFRRLLFNKLKGDV